MTQEEQEQEIETLRAQITALEAENARMRDLQALTNRKAALEQENSTLTQNQTS